jgi:hypothetical protein
MNCFEVRQEFPAMWRKTATAEHRAALTAHLGECSKCDHAFRVFALTAPVLHSPSEPAGRIDAHRSQAEARRGALVSRGSRQPRRMLAMCAGVMAIFVAGMAAYLSVTVPVSSYSDEIINPEPEPAADLPAPDSLISSNDFAG